MRKHNILGRIIICILAISISAVLIAGCQSKTTTTSSANGTTNKTTQGNSRQPNADEMKSNIDSLITAGTITKDQGDKIIEALTANRPQRGNAQGAPKANGEQGNTQNGGQRPKGNSPLSKLVSDGTITQAQADAVMQNMRKGSQPSNSQSAASSNDQSNTSN